MKKCLDEGILQNYLDGELSPEMMKSVATHLAECARCAAAVREAESELAIFAAAFAPDPAVSVPTARLRARIERRSLNRITRPSSNPLLRSRT